MTYPAVQPGNVAADAAAIVPAADADAIVPVINAAAIVLADVTAELEIVQPDATTPEPIPETINLINSE
jgi:hypothetical protein